ncbi:MAG: three-Cys-motif partner protein TcmP [Chloroflexi bacterium]|nr:three-Cys-motif partner protein TcmP [Chloroflexota bacterium]
MARRLTSTEILAELGSEDDGLLKRSIGPWTLEKLAVLLLYIRGFADACKRVGGVYVDGLAGPGLCETGGAQVERRVVMGSPLIALTTPELEHCYLLEKKEPEKAALERRAEAFGGRATVLKGDVNRDLPRLIGAAVEPWRPCFCLLDPEAAELHWATISAIASTPRTKNKPELLILFPLRMSIVRQFPTTDVLKPAVRLRHNRTFGNELWESIYESRLSGELEPPDANRKYLALYKKGLEELGYAYVISKPILAPRTAKRGRQELYHLVFATDDETGYKIMSDVFKRHYDVGLISGGQMELPI